MHLSDIYIRDPYILYCNGVYYMYGKEYLEQREFVVYNSSDLKEWCGPKKVFTPDEKFWADRDFWAPEVHFYNGKYYMIASFKSETKRRGSHIMVSDSPDGEFVPISDKPITPEEWEALDATLYIDRFGKPHIVFCHEWLQVGNGTVCEMLVSDDFTQAISEPRVLWSAGDSNDAVNIDPHRESLITDGPFMHRLKSGELICTWSTFTKSGYSVLIARSDNGDIDGKWSVDEKPLIEENGGHGMIFKSHDGNRIFVMHSPNIDGLERATLYQLHEKDNTIVLEKL